MPVKELCKELAKTYDGVRQTDLRSLVWDYSGSKLRITKKKKGYDVSADVPILLFWMLTICFFVISMINFSFEGNTAYAIGSVLGIVIGTLLWSAFIYWIYAEFYVASKKRIIREFCNSLDLQNNASTSMRE